MKFVNNDNYNDYSEFYSQYVDLSIPLPVPELQRPPDDLQQITNKKYNLYEYWHEYWYKYFYFIIYIFLFILYITVFSIRYNCNEFLESDNERNERNERNITKSTND